jgi:putative glutamine transport system substrate-binding protein
VRKINIFKKFILKNFIFEISILKKIIFSLANAAAIFLCASCVKETSEPIGVDKILKRGILIAGVKVDAPRMGHLNSDVNDFEGMEIDLARLLAEKIFGDPKKVRLKPITVATRVSSLDDDEVDIVIGTFTVNEERKKTVHFSEPYYVETLAFLVRKNDNLKRIADLNGKIIGAMAGTSPISGPEPLKNEAISRGINIEIRSYPDYPSVQGALRSGQVHAFCTSKTVLFGYLDDETEEVMAESFSAQDFAIAVKYGNATLQTYVNDFVKEVKSSGKLEELKNKWDV